MVGEFPPHPRIFLGSSFGSSCTYFLHSRGDAPRGVAPHTVATSTKRSWPQDSYPDLDKNYGEVSGRNLEVHFEGLGETFFLPPKLRPKARGVLERGWKWAGGFGAQRVPGN